jgi:hypothetical protein
MGGYLYRLGGIMSPGWLSCLSRDHYLANLIIHRSLIFCPFLRQIFREVFLILPGGKRILIPEGGYDPEKRTGRRAGPFFPTPPCYWRFQEKGCFPRTPPDLLKPYFCHTNHSPENFRKFWRSGLFILRRKGELFDKRGDRCDCVPGSK